MTTTEEKPVAVLDATQKQDVHYCVPLWVRDEQIKSNIANVPGRIAPCFELRTEPIAVVGVGSSLNDTWEQIKAFKNVITCSGAHKFLVERGVIPTWHCD